MILYFNDYKLIYIITMMGKINNISVLNEDVIRLVVLNEEIIGYIYPRRTSYVVALEIKPGRTTSLATSVNKQCMVLLSDKVRLATEQDFDDFHIEAVIQTVSILNKSDYLKFYFRINI